MNLLLALHILLSFQLASSYLDLEELKTVNYGIDLLDKPVVAGEEAPSGAIFLTSKYGQPYQCSYPDRTVDEQKEKEDEKVAMETGIPELLKPMETGPCLVHTKGWWSYEFCYGQDIKQYHMDDGKITGNVIYLGYYESEFDWENNTESKSRSGRNRLNRYHSQQYVNGSNCDLTSTSRRTEVRFQCEDGSGDYIFRIDEPETCVYILTIHTTKICHHPYLKPPSPNKPVPITCNPLLTEDEYKMYLEETQVETPEETPSVSDSSHISDDAEHTADNDDDDVRGPLPDATDADYDTLLINSLLKGLDGQDADIKMKQVKATDDLGKAFAEMMMKEAKSQKGKDAETDTEDENEEDKKHGLVEAEDGEAGDIDSASVREFEKGLDEMGDRERLASYKDTIRSAVEARFDEILEEAEAELGLTEDLDEGNRREAFEDLAATLDKLLSKLDTAEKDLARADDALEAASAQAEKDERDDNRNRDDDYDADDGDGSSDDDSDEFDGDYTIEGWNGESTSTSLDSQVQQQAPQDSAQTRPSTESDLSTKSTTQSHTTTIDNSVRVRVTRIKQTENMEEEQSTESQRSSKSNLDMPSETKTKLEEGVKNQLEKAGMTAGGNKVHVKIITAGYYDQDDETLHMLSDEDSQAFNKMIITILGGDNEEVKELERQEAMQNAYGFKWGSGNNKNKGKQPSRTPGQDP